MANIYPRTRDGKLLSYYVTFVDPTRSPSRKRISLRTKDKKTAELKARKLERQYAKGEYDPWNPRPKALRKKVSVEDAANYVLESRYSKLAEKTYTNRLGILNLFMDHVGKAKDIRSVTSYHVRTFLSDYEGGTARTFYSQLRTFFNDLAAVDVIEENPMDKIRMPKNKQPTKVIVLTEEEYETLKTIPLEWLRMCCIIAYHTGMRHGEIRHLRWEHIDFEEGLIHVKNTKWHKTKNRKDRIVPLTNTLRNELIHWRDRYLEIPWELRDNSGDWVLVDMYGKPPTQGAAIKSFRRWRKRLGLRKELTLHKFRHTYASRCVRSGMPLHVLKEILGHAKMQTVMIYAHLNTETLQQWVEKIFDSDS